MRHLLAGLERATDECTARFVRECKHNNDMAMLANVERTKLGVKFARYEITLDRIPYGDMIKNYYDVIEVSSGNRIYVGVSLFESAMGIIKHLMFNYDLFRCNRIMALDRTYDSHMLETYALRQKISEKCSTDAYAIYEAKLSTAVDKARYAKSKILRTI